MARKTKRRKGAHRGLGNAVPERGAGRDRRARTPDQGAPAPLEGSLPRTPAGQASLQRREGAAPLSWGLARGTAEQEVVLAGWSMQGWGPPRAPRAPGAPSEGLSPTSPQRTRKTHLTASLFSQRGARGSEGPGNSSEDHSARAAGEDVAGRVSSLGPSRTWSPPPQLASRPCLVPGGLGTVL